MLVNSGTQKALYYNSFFTFLSHLLCLCWSFSNSSLQWEKPCSFLQFWYKNKLMFTWRFVHEPALLFVFHEWLCICVFAHLFYTQLRSTDQISLKFTHLRSTRTVAELPNLTQLVSLKVFAVTFTSEIDFNTILLFSNKWLIYVHWRKRFNVFLSTS